jgi:hypothetical protein
MIEAVKDLLNDEIIQLEELEEKMKEYIPEGGGLAKTDDIEELKEMLNIFNKMEEHYLNMQKVLISTLDGVNEFRTRFTSTLVMVDDEEED